MSRRFAAGVALAGLLPALAPAAARAAGFSLYEQGARALGMSGATTARSDDPSAMFFNPAGLANVDGKALLLSPNLILYQVHFAGVDPYPGYGVTEETEKKAFPPFSAYLALGTGRVTVGLGVMNPYGLEVDWADQDEFTGRFVSTRSKITPFYFTPTVACALTPELRAGLGASVVLSNVELERHLSAYNPFDDRTEDIGTVRLESETGDGFGVNAGVQWWPGKWRVGATYRGNVNVEYGGSADFTQRSTGNPTFDAIVASSFPPDQRVRTDIEFPAQASLGVGLQASPSLSLEGDLSWTNWSSFDRLEIRFDQTPSRDQTIDEAWDDVFNVRVGAEYRKNGTSPWSWRAGYSFDDSPQPTRNVGPLLPDADRHGASLGGGWSHGGTRIDAYALYLFVADRSTEGTNRDGFDGTYSLETFVLGASLGLSFE